MCHLGYSRKFTLSRGVLREVPYANIFNVHMYMYVQIKSESFLEDVNNILNSGDVPNIYPPEDLDKIFAEMKPVVQDSGLQPTKSNLFSAYTKRVRSNIHMVICMRCVIAMCCVCVCVCVCV